MSKIPDAVDTLLNKVELAAINRWHIFALLFLGVGLLTQGSNPQFELVGGNYTNIISAVVSLLVLAEQKRSEARQAQRHADMKDHVTEQTGGESNASDGN